MKLALIVLISISFYYVCAMDRSPGIQREARSVTFLDSSSQENSFRLSSDSQSQNVSFRLSPDGSFILGDKTPSVLIRHLPSIVAHAAPSSVNSPEYFGATIIEIGDEEDLLPAVEKLSVAPINTSPKKIDRRYSGQEQRLPLVDLDRFRVLSFLTKRELELAVSAIDFGINQMAYIHNNAYKLLDEAIEEDDVLSVFLLLRYCRSIDMLQSDQNGFTFLHKVIRRNGSNMATIVVMLLEYVYRNARASAATAQNPIDVADHQLAYVVARGQLIEHRTKIGVCIREGKNALRFLFEHMGREISHNLGELSEKAQHIMPKTLQKLNSPVSLTEQDELFLIKSFARFNQQDHPLFFVAMLLKEVCEIKRAIFSFEGRDIKKRSFRLITERDLAEAHPSLPLKKRIAVAHVPKAMFKLEVTSPENESSPAIITCISPGETNLSLPGEDKKPKYPKSPHIKEEGPRFVPISEISQEPKVPQQPAKVLRKAGSAFRHRK